MSNISWPETDASIQRILAWLAPPRFAEVLENSKDQRQEGTAQWIFENDCFKEWRASHPRPDTWIKTGKLPPWVLWVNGKCQRNPFASLSPK